jgi:hypothetical protein
METMRSRRRAAQPHFVNGSSWERRRWVAVDGGEARTGTGGSNAWADLVTTAGLPCAGRPRPAQDEQGHLTLI